MAELKYVGKPADNDLGLMTHGDVNQRFATQYVSQADVDAVVNPQLPPLVSLSYVQQQDALIARTTYVDQQDALYELRSDRGVANGIAYLGADGKLPAEQMPTLVGNKTRIYRTTTPSNTTWTSISTSTERTIDSMSIDDPGYPYTIIATATLACRSEGDFSHAAAEIRIGSTSGTAISHGYGTEQQSWHWIKVLPQAVSGNAGVVRTGATTLYLRGYRESGDASIDFSDSAYSMYVWIVPAIS